MGLALDRDGFLWVQTLDQLLRVSTGMLQSGSLQPSGIRLFNQADGLMPTADTRRTRSLAVDSSGNVWVATRAGLFTATPQAFEDRSPPSIVQMDGLAADGREIALQQAVVPAPPHRVTLRFSAVSLPVPERVRYRYRLDGFDGGWSDATSAREAIYTRLEPGQYRFRLLATNSEGVWNSAEFSFPFTIKPAIWQTVWFRVCSLLLLLLVARWMYLLRMQQIANGMNMRFEERLAERMRIAQDLHDTLIQGFLSASMQLDVASDYVAPESTAASMLARVLALMQRVIEDTRRSVSNLRAPEQMSRNLEAELSHIPREMERGDGVEYRVTVSGSARALDPACSHDVLLISREAVLNAYRHAQARRIEVEVVYDSASLRLTIRDDGKGMDEHVLQQGRDGHWGLTGMRERAAAIGAKLRLWSRASLGTEVELTVPGHLAYSRANGRRPWWVSRKAPARQQKNIVTEKEHSYDGADTHSHG
ncbi:MAG: ATP-binding protein [Rhodospirillales bacterium]|nr:ATP-binding protein [Acetobacter sp.]